MTSDAPEKDDAAGCDAPDPDDLGQCRPAVVLLSGPRQRRHLVADATIVREGWLRTTDWSGQVTRYPPQTVEGVREVALERVEDGSLSVRIADADLRAEARENCPDAADTPEAVMADD